MLRLRRRQRELLVVAGGNLGVLLVALFIFHVSLTGPTSLMQSSLPAPTFNPYHPDAPPNRFVLHDWADEYQVENGAGDHMDFQPVGGFPAQTFAARRKREAGRARQISLVQEFNPYHPEAPPNRFEMFDSLPEYQVENGARDHQDFQPVGGFPASTFSARRRRAMRRPFGV